MDSQCIRDDTFVYFKLFHSSVWLKLWVKVRLCNTVFPPTEFSRFRFKWENEIRDANLWKSWSISEIEFEVFKGQIRTSGDKLLFHARLCMEYQEEWDWNYDIFSIKSKNENNEQAIHKLFESPSLLTMSQPSKFESAGDFVSASNNNNKSQCCHFVSKQ